MARELGMNPKKFGKLDNHQQERWKLPLGQFIEECYRKRFGRLPTTVLSIEERARLEEKKRAARQETKSVKRQATSVANTPQAQSAPLADGITEVYLGDVTIDDFRRNARGELGTRTATLHKGGIKKLRDNWIYRL
jgi:hypothetical protein